MPAILPNKGSTWLAVSIILNSFRIFNSPKISLKYAKPYLLSLSSLLLMSISSLCKGSIPLLLNYQKKLESLCIRQEELNDVPFALFDVWIRFTFWFLCTIMQNQNSWNMLFNCILKSSCSCESLQTISVRFSTK